MCHDFVSTVCGDILVIVTRVVVSSKCLPEFFDNFVDTDDLTFLGVNVLIGDNAQPSENCPESILLLVDISLVKTIERI
jgi:hypothetical protein